MNIPVQDCTRLPRVQEHMDHGKWEAKTELLQLLKFSATLADSINMYALGLQVGFSLLCLAGAIERTMPMPKQLREAEEIPAGMSHRRETAYRECWYSATRIPGVLEQEHEELVRLMGECRQ